ncbi:Clathrin light chain A [Nymphon striatum]|nr:Clathrin light chain A [Nymphon striatum]
MSDMDAFGDDIPQEQNQNENEVDPAAEFLAREQSELAGLQDDNFEVVSNEQNGGKYLALQCAIQVTDIAAEESPNPSPPQEPIITNGPAEEFTPQVTQIKNVKEEPEKLKLWREKQQEMLEQKDEEEEKKKNELRDGAKKELDEWYSRYNDQIEKSKVNNSYEGGSVDLLCNAIFQKSILQLPERGVLVSINYLLMSVVVVVGVDFKLLLAFDFTIKIDKKSHLLQKLAYQENTRQLAGTHPGLYSDVAWNAEKEYVTARDATQPGQEWERIATLCDFNPKSSRATKDVSRMRSILLQLKQTPPAKA